MPRCPGDKYEHAIAMLVQFGEQLANDVLAELDDHALCATVALASALTIVFRDSDLSEVEREVQAAALRHLADVIESPPSAPKGHEA